ncbi:hypothetical protein T440DRAFT_135196 [Plenodomus tracheiphilus IPT5]|uniref:Uncharacterized protein n=1 Tax=Plenodomus tracheiphilus IPT5 TaxID=1408161 RepID=A0A6A7B1H6_9PLEO|nr:hypothetical protein T440DRAFT_135196 [Plenodomus tracheiphilus IPT5]
MTTTTTTTTTTTSTGCTYSTCDDDASRLQLSVRQPSRVYTNTLVVPEYTACTPCWRLLTPKHKPAAAPVRQRLDLDAAKSGARLRIVPRLAVARFGRGRGPSVIQSPRHSVVLPRIRCLPSRLHRLVLPKRGHTGLALPK